MNALVIAIGCCLLAQPPADDDPYRPKVVPSAPAAVDADESQPAETSPFAEQPTTPPESAPAPAFGLPDEFPAAGAPDSGGTNAGASEPSGPDANRPEPTGPRDSLEGLDTSPADEAAPDADMAPVGSVPRQRLRPPELLAEALASPQEGGLQGVPVPLVAALARSPDRQQQLRIAQSYWQLAAAQADFHWAREERDLLDHYLKAHADLPAVQSARAAAAANVRDAQLAVAQAQQEMGDLLGTAGAELPLSVDRPHVGSYNTYFQEIFGGGRLAPARIRLIDRTLPIRRQAIDAHAAAIVAARDALDATGEQFATGGQGLATLLALGDRLHDERQAFIAAVRDYNQEIAEYLFAVVRPGTSDQVLVSRLILTSPKSSSPSVDETPAESAAPPTFAPQEPGNDALPRPPASEPPVDTQTSNYQPADVGELLGDGGGLYRGLVDLHPPARVQKLAGLLHWDRGLPTDGTRPAALADCLGGVVASERLALLTAYWQARECAATYQVLGERLEQLNALGAAVIALRDQPGIAEAGVRLQAARRTAKGALLDAQLALVEAEFRLTQTAHRSLDEAWLLPATPPQSGRYVVAQHAPGALARAAAAVSSRHAELEDRADAVIRADELRAGVGGAVGAATDFGSPAGGTAGELSQLDQVVWAVGRQTDETLAFVRNLTEYNLAIARYALATSPPEIASDELVRRLVIARTARGET